MPRLTLRQPPARRPGRRAPRPIWHRPAHWQPVTSRLRAQQAQADAEGVRFKLSDLRYQNGIASQLDLLDAQRSLFSARQAVVQTRLLQLQNQVTLYKALGGGWKDAANPTGTAAASASR